jgi:carbamoylphosphate synthase large subunit
MNPSNHIVLLGSAGTGSAFASAKALRKYFDVKIISVDTNSSNLVTTSLLSDIFLKIPSFETENFEDIITKILVEQKIDTYIPFIDNEIYKVAVLFEKKLISNNIFLQLKDPSVAFLCMDKYQSYNWLKTNGYPTPDTFLIKNSNEFRVGYILKPRLGYGSKIQTIRTDCNFHIENFDDVIMQRQCYFPEITIDVHYSKKFDFFAYVCRERIETKSGVCTKARIFKEPVLGEIALSLAKKLDLSSFCFQMMTLNNEYVITDINPRLGAGTAMSGAVGLEFYAAMFATLWGENPEKYFQKFSEEKYVTRQYSEFIM